MKYSFSKKILLNRTFILPLLSRTVLLAVGGLLLSSVWSQGVAQERWPGERHRAIAQRVEVPEPVSNAVINDAARRTGIPASSFAIVEAEPRDWPDGCLGLAAPGTVCTQVIVPGWRVVVSTDEQTWVYRTDQDGTQVKLAEGATAPGGNQAYTDIDGHWAQGCIQRLSQQGILSGYPDHTFQPDRAITRAEYAALINQAFPTVAAEREAINFTDVPVYYWGQESIQTAYRKGFLSGYPNQQFRPNDLISRVEAYVALASGLDYSPPDAPQTVLIAAYADADRIPGYAAGAIAAATQQGIVVTAVPDTAALNPSDPATRAQIAATLCTIQYDDASLPEGYVVNPIAPPEAGTPISLGQTCENTASGFTVRYPDGWLTNDGDVTERCRVFDPESVSLPEQSSSLDEAIHIRIDHVPFERVVPEDDPTGTLLSRRATTVDGYEAIVTEQQSNGRGLIPEGVNTYTYLVNLNDGNTLIATTYDFAGQPYARNKQVLDQMIETLAINR